MQVLELLGKDVKQPNMSKEICDKMNQMETLELKNIVNEKKYIVNEIRTSKSWI